jgi:hypothetical protein
VYENRMKSYTARLSEIEEKIAIFEARELIKKERGLFRKQAQKEKQGGKKAA